MAKAWSACSRCYAPTIAEITVVRRGDVRRAKLYYLRGRSGKSARIAERARTVDLPVPRRLRRSNWDNRLFWTGDEGTPSRQTCL